MIFIDPTEARQGTRLPQDVIEKAQILVHLEAETGADFLITPLSRPSLGTVITDSKLSYAKLYKHTQAGALVQRKSGLDLLNSIKKLDVILDRMLAWTPRPILLGTGSFCPYEDGQVICNGKPTGWSYNSFWGALESWQLSGGFVRLLYQDSDILQWVARLNNKLIAVRDDEPKLIERQWQRTVSWNNDAFKQTLMTLPGIGLTLADRVGNHCGNLIWSEHFLTDPASAGKLPGITTKRIQTIRDYYGLKEGQVIGPWPKGETPFNPQERKGKQ